MRASAVVLMVIVAMVIGYFIGRDGRSDSSVAMQAPPEPHRFAIRETPEQASESLVVALAPTEDPAERLLAAINMPEGFERRRETRVWTNAWLAADGAGALAIATGDSRFEEITDQMVRLAVQVYPEVLFDDLAILDGLAQRDSLLAQAIHTIASYDPQRARDLIGEHLQTTQLGTAMLSSIDRVANRSDTSTIVEDPRGELQSALDEPDLSKRTGLLMRLISRVAANDPAFAAELLDEVPPSLMHQPITWSLINTWVHKDPLQAARWLVNANSMVTQRGLTQVAQVWGQRDFSAASAFADELLGSQRSSYLAALANATGQMSTDEMLNWISAYRTDLAYPQLVNAAAQRLVQQDPDAALKLVEELPAESRLKPYATMLPRIAMQNPEKAIEVLEKIDDPQIRAQLTPMIASMLASTDAKRALDWARDQEKGPLRDQAIAGVASVLAQTDPSTAKRVVEEIDDTSMRKGPIMVLLQLAPSDEAAIRLGQEYGYDRQTVLTVRSGGGMFSIGSSALIGGFSSQAFQFQQRIIRAISRDNEE